VRLELRGQFADRRLDDALQQRLDQRLQLVENGAEPRLGRRADAFLCQVHGGAGHLLRDLLELAQELLEPGQ
jgi:hypothetical protein